MPDYPSDTMRVATVAALLAVSAALAACNGMGGSPYPPQPSCAGAIDSAWTALAASTSPDSVRPDDPTYRPAETRSVPMPSSDVATALHGRTIVLHLAVNEMGRVDAARSAIEGLRPTEGAWEAQLRKEAGAYRFVPATRRGCRVPSRYTVALQL